MLNLRTCVSRLELAFLLVVFAVSLATLSFRFTKSAKAAGTLTGASVTLSNSRMSFKAPITSGAAGGSVIQISGAAPDTTTNHLFPGDKVCFTDAGTNVCRDNTTYTVSNITDTTHFTVATPLTTTLTGTDFAVATASGTWTITFTTVNAVPIGGKLTVTIPANDANSTTLNNTGMPDSAATVATNGFAINGVGGTLANASVTASTCTGGVGNWGASGAAASFVVGGGGATDTVITWNRATAICAGGSTITVTITGNGIVNPAPITGHTQGNADVYGVAISTTDGTNIIDTSTPRVAPIEAVLISANIDENLTLIIAGIASGGSYCGNANTVTSTATSIPWGHFAAVNTFNYAAQQLTVNTNAISGYTVTIQENDQMGKNGNVCTGTAPAANGYTFGSGTCIRDTVCSAATPCTETVMGDWPAAANYSGLGYSLASQSGTDAVFWYSQGGRTWNAKSLADVQGGDTIQTIMGNTGPVSGSSIYVCYKISISGTQPSGYYYNIAKYTATATF